MTRNLPPSLPTTAGRSNAWIFVSLWNTQHPFTRRIDFHISLRVMVVRATITRTEAWHVGVFNYQFFLVTGVFLIYSSVVVGTNE